MLVARVGAGLPGAAVDWGAGPVALAALTGLCVVVGWPAPRVLRHPVERPGGMLPAGGLRGDAPPTPGWPPDGWVLAACDVGQGDALVVHVGEGRGLVVDAGPDPTAVDGCLRRLDVVEVPVLVLTHFHADHVDGLRGVLDGAGSAEVLVTSLADPAEGAAQVAAATSAAGVPVAVATYGETRTVGAATLQVAVAAGRPGAARHRGQPRQQRERGAAGGRGRAAAAARPATSSRRRRPRSLGP